MTTRDTSSPAVRPLGAQISHMLKDRGIDVIFGIPGVHNQEMYRGIEEAGITHVLARHEQGAGFMADGYARATGRPGVAYVITGPGLCNIMTPMGQAYSDSVGMLVISSCLDEAAATRGQLHQMKDQRGAAETVCDWSEEARGAEAAYALIDRALTEFGTKRPRPKHIQVPIAQLESPASPASPPLTNAAPNQPGDFDASEVAQALRNARRPLFLLGGGAAAPHSAELARKVIARTGAAVLPTFAGRGIVPANDPLNFGPCLPRGFAPELLSRADLIIAVGTELAQGDLWRDRLEIGCELIRVDIDPQVLSDLHRADRAIMSDAFTFFDRLDAALPETLIKDWSAEDIAEIRRRTRAEIDAERPGILPVIDALRAATPEDAMIYSDMTQIAYAAKEVWDMPRPGHWHHPTGFGTLGYALPAAIGGAVARPGLPTMCLIGDYGLHYTMAELGVAVELGLPLPIVVWDNGKLGEIEDSMTRAQIAPNAVVARNPDFVKLADAFGARAVAPATLDDIGPALAAAFEADGPTVIHLTPQITG